MNADYINPFLNATKNVIETMAFTPLEAGKPFLKENNLSWGVVNGIIGLASDKLKGAMVISFDEGSILGIVSEMLGEPFTEINHDVTDAVGEITNMISGGAKAELAQLGFQMRMATPVMLVGQGVEMSQLTKSPVISMPLNVEVGKFVIEANLNKLE